MVISNNPTRDSCLQRLNFTEYKSAFCLEMLKLSLKFEKASTLSILDPLLRSARIFQKSVNRLPQPNVTIVNSTHSVVAVSIGKKIEISFPFIYLLRQTRSTVNGQPLDLVALLNVDYVVEVSVRFYACSADIGYHNTTLRMKRMKIKQFRKLNETSQKQL